MTWPINPSLITLRVCADLGWTVTARCPKCRVGTTLHGEKMGQGNAAHIPLERLFRDGKIRCKKVQYGCSGTPASGLSVDAIDVGMSKTVAKWEK
jgi:hypothetical protein